MTKIEISFIRETIISAKEHKLFDRPDARVTIVTFIEYWLEKPKRARKYRFEKQDTFEHSRRLKTFFRNREKWRNNVTTVNQKIHKIDENKIRL